MTDSNGLRREDAAAIEKLGDARQRIIDQLAQVIVGQSEVIDELLIRYSAAGTASWRACRGWRRR